MTRDRIVALADSHNPAQCGSAELVHPQTLNQYDRD